MHHLELIGPGLILIGAMNILVSIAHKLYEIKKKLPSDQND